MSILKDYRRVSQRHRCEVCGRPDWCLLSRDGTSVICARVPDGAERYITGLDGEHVGYLHRTGKAPVAYVAPEPEPVLSSLALDTILQQCHDDLDGENLANAAIALGVSQRSLLQLDIGWHKQYQAHSFPMRDAAGDSVGIRLRSPSTGRKWAIRGSRSGLFLASQCYQISGQLVICEGPTDTAAALTLELEAVGRPFCRGGTADLLSLVRQLGSSIVIVADSDGPGVAGAYALADAMFGVAAGIRIIKPRGKDMREWVKAGASRGVFDALVDNCPLYQQRKEAA